jgi:hypothetical protein
MAVNSRCGHAVRNGAVRQIENPLSGTYGPRSPSRIDGTALPQAAARMGRSQVVRQRILIPPFPGSNPGAPANI